MPVSAAAMMGGKAVADLRVDAGCQRMSLRNRQLCPTGANRPVSG